MKNWTTMNDADIREYLQDKFSGKSFGSLDYETEITTAVTYLFPTDEWAHLSAKPDPDATRRLNFYYDNTNFLTVKVGARKVPGSRGPDWEYTNFLVTGKLGKTPLKDRIAFIKKVKAGLQSRHTTV